MIAKVGIHYPMHRTGAAKKDLFVVSHFICRGDNFATGRTNTAGLFEDFGQDGSPYMLIFFQTLSTKGWQVDPARYELPGKDLVLHTARPVRKDRASLAAFLGQSMIGGTLLRAPVI